MDQAPFAKWISKRMRWGISQSQVSQWESGCRGIARSNALELEIATSGKVPADELAAWIEANRREPKRRPRAKRKTQGKAARS